MNIIKINRFRILSFMIASILCILTSILLASIGFNWAGLILSFLVGGTLGFLAELIGSILDTLFPPKQVAPFPPPREVWRK